MSVCTYFNIMGGVILGWVMGLSPHSVKRGHQATHLLICIYSTLSIEP